MYAAHAHINVVMCICCTYTIIRSHFARSMLQCNKKPAFIGIVEQSTYPRFQCYMVERLSAILRCRSIIVPIVCILSCVSGVHIELLN